MQMGAKGSLPGVTETISAQNQFTDEIEINDYPPQVSTSTSRNIFYIFIIIIIIIVTIINFVSHVLMYIFYSIFITIGSMQSNSENINGRHHRAQ